MKRTLILLSLLSASLSLYAQAVVDWDAAYAEADRIISTLTLDEKIDLTRGTMSFYFPEVPGKGINYVYLSDATQGVNIRKGHHIGIRPLEKSTAFPCPIMLSATFNPALAHRYGKDVGEECSTANIRVLLGPGMNLYRDSQCGRNFEYFGEDPYHVGVMVSEYIKGLQSTGTAACAKHFVCNNIEWQRRNCNVIIDERTIQELYMPHFQAAVDAGLAFVMTSYNLVNGEYAGQSKEVINGYLRGDLGFRGGVMSDWHSVYDYPKMILSGQNIEMPGKNTNIVRGTLDIAMRSGQISEGDIDNAIRPLIATCIAFNLYDPDVSDASLIETFPRHEADSYEVAAEGVVLLKNNGVLPLRGSDILVTGRFIDELPRGKGSGNVPGYNNVSLRQALTEVFGDRVKFVPDASAGEIAAAKVVICSAGTTDAEDIERPFALAEKDNAAVLNAIRNNPNTVLLVNSGSGVRMADYMDASAIVYGWYPGQAGMRAVADILAGKINPSGKLPFSIEREFSDSPAYGDIPEYVHKGQAVLGERNINEFHSKIYDVEYDEGVFVGYRWFEAKNIKPLFAFGHGLSYTDFSLKPTVTKGRISDSQPFKFSVKLRNTGGMDGKEVVQVYVGENNPSVERPIKELKAYRKVEVKRGRSETVDFEISARDLAFWDVETHGWKSNRGAYTIYVGTSSDNISFTIPIH